MDLLFLAPQGFQIPPNSAGGFLGLFNTTTSDSSQNQIVLVEFDSFSNPEWDPPIEHVGINSNSISSAVFTPWNVSLHSEDNIDVWIAYNSTTKNLSVHWTYQTTSNSNENTSLSYQIDLKKVLPQWVTIGFSAATGQYVERHTLNSWEFTSTLDIKEGGDGKKARRKRLILGLTVSGGGVFIVGAIVAILVLLLFRRKQKKKKRETAETMNLTSINDDLERGAGPRRFSYADLASATRNFSDERKLGEGGFGAVYRGYLVDLDVTVAVKKISRGSRQGRKEYITEVKVISSLRHRNLVQLIGWCHDGGEFFSCTTSALLYLHEEWEQCVVHRDIKSSNVMLDSNFNVKLGDFGLARLMDHELGPQTTGLAGTFGYLAPEYISTGRASKESDVYSFGVVCLEIATGRKSVDRIDQKNTQMGLVEWIWDLYGNGNLDLGVDGKLEIIEMDKEQVKCLMIVGLWCAHPDRCLRPSIRQAIHVLNFESAYPNLPSSMPLPLYQVLSPSVSSGEPSITTSIGIGR
ncbi:hypothetical protein FNV43_RR18483 [Rhamnella rubrinervis]|uniref:Protein kinase domain-containing protein n=1 Tax=Rhamnella rubrinervis TaxID=2594499 RepID=A0A8K0GSZ2_9ROSA|nr:hypothetical protein FNV43_RR18483 [Rhamnella rubrinervis]